MFSTGRLPVFFCKQRAKRVLRSTSGSLISKLVGPAKMRNPDTQIGRLRGRMRSCRWGQARLTGIHHDVMALLDRN
jgi:hypothetical protein